MKIQAVLPDERWDRYVAGQPRATGCHRAAWASVIEASFGHQTVYLAAESGGSTVGILPLVIFRSRIFGKFVVSMPFLNYGGVVADTPEIESALLDAAIDLTRREGGSHLELRHTRRVFPALSPKTHKVAMLLTLEDSVDRQWHTLDRKVRNQIRKAEKQGLLVRCGGQELLSSFYGVFAHNMRDLGTPVYGLRFFREVMVAFQGTARIVCVLLGDTPVAAALVLWHGQTLEVPWASSLRSFNHLCANVLLYWNAVTLAIDHGLRLVDLGRSTPSEGTYNFKRQWGASPVPLVWEYWLNEGEAMPDLSPHNPKFRHAIAAWQHLPVGLTRMLGPAIVRNLP